MKGIWEKKKDKQTLSGFEEHFNKTVGCYQVMTFLM